MVEETEVPWESCHLIKSHWQLSHMDSSEKQQVVTGNALDHVTIGAEEGACQTSHRADEKKLLHEVAPGNICVLCLL